MWEKKAGSTLVVREVARLVCLVERLTLPRSLTALWAPVEKRGLRH